MEKPVSIAIIGAGFGQQVHLPAFESIPGCKVKVLCARNPEKIQPEAAQRVSLVANDWRPLIADPDIDAFSLALPPSAQAEVAVAAARTGKHLFCEKPLALNSRQAQEIFAVADRKGIVHAMDFIFPELPTWQKARELVLEGKLGKIRSVALTWRVETFIYRTGAQNWKTRINEGGGTLNNFASHSLYYLEWLFGRMVKLSARLLPVEAEVEARADAWIEFAAGFPGTISIAADAFLGPGHRIEVYGDKGSLILENPGSDYARGFKLFVGTRAEPELRAIDCGPVDPNPDGRIRPVSRIAERFVRGIRDGGKVEPNLADGLRVQALSDALRLAHTSGAWQDVRLL